jgi:peptidoglycan/LPS O-acetylase OafA/YrhL
MLLSPKRFYSLDVLRGIAALSIVLWHWQHFFLPLNSQGAEFSADKQPLYEYLYIFYQFGIQAVQLFFSLSGFIFFWLYSKRIAERAISPQEFSILRLSRLYPLHIVTLILVALGQTVYTNISNHSFVYSLNDTYHFILNLLFASSWGFEEGPSFNAPIWSVSVEMILYAIFYMFCRMFNRNAIAVISVIAIGHFLLPKFNGHIASGVESFFLGGLVFIAYQKAITLSDKWRIAVWLPVIAVVAWILTFLSSHPSAYFTPDEFPWLIQKVKSAWAIYFLFPITIMSLALIETKRGTLGKRLAFVGDISYSSYLLHFPLQLAVAIIATKVAIDPMIFYSAWFMALFYSLLILLSLASYHYFELPVQLIFRRKAK